MLLRELVKGSENTVQGKAILKQLIPAASSSPTSFWQKSREKHDAETSALQFRARL